MVPRVRRGAGVRGPAQGALYASAIVNAAWKLDESLENLYQ